MLTFNDLLIFKIFIKVNKCFINLINGFARLSEPSGASLNLFKGNWGNCFKFSLKLVQGEFTKVWAKDQDEEEKNMMKCKT